MKSGIIVLGHDNDRPVEGPGLAWFHLFSIWEFCGLFVTLPHAWQQSLRFIVGLPDSAMIAEGLERGFAPRSEA
jgi:hypothetical protein